MTARDAFAIAFDEVVAMDAMPGMGLNMKTPKPAGSGLPKAPAAAKGMGDQTSTGEGEMMTLAEHDEKNHKGGYKGGRCTWRDKHGMSGMTLEEAMSKGLANKKFPGGNDDEMPTDGQPQQTDPMMQEQAVQQMVQNPQAIESAQSQMLMQPEEIGTNAGEIPVQTTIQKAVVEALEERSDAGDPQAAKGLMELKELVDGGEVAPADGTDVSKEEESSGGMQSNLSPIDTNEGPSDKALDKEGANESPTEEPTPTEESPVSPAEEPQGETMPSSDGSYTHELTPKQAAIIKENPDKKELLQKWVDLAAKWGDNSTDDGERKDLKEQGDALMRMFYGKDGIPPEEDSAIDGNGGDRESPEGSVPPSNPPTPPDNPPDESPTPPEGGDRDRSYPDDLAPAPSDEEFRVGKNKYKVNGITYVDVSGMGMLRSALSAFIAGLHGEGVLTGWDRISGSWDAKKRSAKGEMVRDGITSALLKSEIGGYADREDLSTDARLELAPIQDMMEQAKTPKEHMAAVKAFLKWKEKYSKEIRKSDSVSGTGGFSNLAQRNPDWKAPPTSIFPPVSKDERDTSYMEEKKKQIEERIGSLAEVVDSINGSSVVRFKVRRFADGTDKMLQDALKAMQSDIGAKISYTPDTNSGAERMGTITINNPNVKDASLQRLLEDNEALEAAKKMEIPLLLGETAEGRAMYVDLKDHGFLGGDSGSGKSERVIGAVSGAFSVKSPSELQVVFNAHANDADYDGFSDDPHTGGIGRTVDEVAQNLANANDEWKRRQKLFAEVGARNIADYNKMMDAAGTPEKKLPSMLVITDEVTDLLAQRPELADEIDAIVRNGRKFGVAHLGITQDMGADNMPSRIKGATRMGVQSASATASKKIFDVHAPELANLNRKGDIMVKDSSGNLVRLRGTYADKATRQALRDYNTGKLKPSDTTTPEGTKGLPKEYLDGIAEAVKTGNKVSVEAMEGLGDAFRDALPEGWTVSEETVDGTKYWKATPPAKEPSKPAEEPEAQQDWTNASNRQEAVSALENQLKKAKDAAWEEFKKSKKTPADKTKYLKAVKKAESELQEDMELVNSQFPEEFVDADSDTEEIPEEKPDEADKSEDNHSEESKRAMSTMQRLHEKALEKLDKAIERTTSMRETAKLEQERSELEKRFSAAKQRYDEGGTAQDITDIYEPEEAKPEEEAEENNQEENGANAEPTPEQQEEQQKKERSISTNLKLQEDDYSAKRKAIEKNKYLSVDEKQRRIERLDSEHDATVKRIKEGTTISQIAEERKARNAEIKKKIPTTRKGKPLPGAEHILKSTRGNAANIVPMPKEVFSKASANLPEGWEIDSDTNGTPLWDGKKGFARNPETGVYALIRPDGSFNVQIDPENPNFRGVNSKEAQKAREALNRNKNPNKEAALLEKYNYIAWGVPNHVYDEAPDNITLVANAVANALKNI